MGTRDARRLRCCARAFTRWGNHRMTNRFLGLGAVAYALGSGWSAGGAYIIGRNDARSTPAAIRIVVVVSGLLWPFISIGGVATVGLAYIVACLIYWFTD